MTTPGFYILDGYTVYNGRGYKLEQISKKSYSAAQSACQADNANAHLAFPVTQTDFDFVQKWLLNTAGVSVVWFGGDMSTPGVLALENGRSAEGFAINGGAYEQPPFAAGEPATQGCTLHQISQSGVPTGRLLGKACTLTRAYVCEIAESDLIAA